VVIDPIRDSEGNLVGYAKITRDLSERRRAEEQLWQRQEQLRLLVQGVTDYALYMLDLNGRVSSWNAGAERIKGYTRDEILGHHFSRFYTEEEREAGVPSKALQQAAAEGRWETEGWRLRKDGSRFWAHVVVDAIRNDAGELIGFAKITRDVTDRKNAEQELAQAREALFHSQKMEAVGQLTGGRRPRLQQSADGHHRRAGHHRSQQANRYGSSCRDMQPTGPPALPLVSLPSRVSSPLSRRYAISMLWSATWPTCSTVRWANR
jgi:PAS domain S-box-containing protein